MEKLLSKGLFTRVASIVKARVAVRGRGLNAPGRRTTTGDRAKRLAQQSGSSLVELVSTMAIFGVLVMTSIPHVDSARQDCNTMVRQVISDYRWARARAITSGVHFSLKWEGPQRYQVQRHQEIAGQWLVEKIVKTVELPEHLTFVDLSLDTVEFNTRGMVVFPGDETPSPEFPQLADSKFNTARTISIWPSGQIHYEGVNLS